MAKAPKKKFKKAQKNKSQICYLAKANTVVEQNGRTCQSKQKNKREKKITDFSHLTPSLHLQQFSPSFSLFFSLDYSSSFISLSRRSISFFLYFSLLSLLLLFLFESKTAKLRSGQDKAFFFFLHIILFQFSQRHWAELTATKVIVPSPHVNLLVFFLFFFFLNS